jgi:hypothetical protein
VRPRLPPDARGIWNFMLCKGVMSQPCTGTVLFKGWICRRYCIDRGWPECSKVRPGKKVTEGRAEAVLRLGETVLFCFGLFVSAMPMLVLDFGGGSW